MTKDKIDVKIGSEDMVFWEEVKKNPRMVFGYDHVTAWYNLNDVTYPDLLDCSIKKT